jgi:perosamine synthetase
VEFIPVARPSVGQEEIDAVIAVMRSGMIAAGERVAELERSFAGYCGVPHAVAVNNGTAALHAALLAAGIGPGDEVIVPAFTFYATASSVLMCGATPVFADVDERTFNIDPRSIGELITEKTRAVIAVHLFGLPFDVPVVREICRRHGLVLIEDAAQAHGARYNGQRTGSFGDLACFSFYATKNMITGEGGMVTTGDRALDGRLRLIVNHGQSEKYLHTCLGYNYRMTDMAAALGLVQLGRLKGFNIQRRKNAVYYNEHISVEGLLTPTTPAGMEPVYHQYVIRLNEGFPMDRPVFMEFLKSRGIGSAVHYPVPLPRQPVFGLKNDPDSCPVATRLAGSVLSLPVHPLVSENQLAYICETINGVK